MEDILSDECEEVCYVPECRYDNFNLRCNECQSWMLGNNVCNFACNRLEYNYDNGDCNCEPDCSRDKLLNNECDWECYTSRCSYDMYADCPVRYN